MSKLFKFVKMIVQLCMQLLSHQDKCDKKSCGQLTTLGYLYLDFFCYTSTIVPAPLITVLITLCMKGPAYGHTLSARMEK